jgi:6-pyruvoyltetrahydropterin/6-carboxytetrahydropterin synthase
VISARRYHDISCGHRVYGHESKCAHLHGHNYRVHFEVSGALDSVGRVMDFSVIKSRLCDWLESHWDHRFLLWNKDPAADALLRIDGTVVLLPFNPTAENMATYLLHDIGPKALQGTGITLVACTVEETAKCSAGATV